MTKPQTREDLLIRIKQAEAEILALESRQNHEEIRKLQRYQDGINARIAEITNAFKAFAREVGENADNKTLPLGLVAKIPAVNEPGMFYEIRKTR